VRIFANLISNILLLLGITGLIGMAIVRIHANVSGIDAEKWSGASQNSEYILQSQASFFIVASYLGILGLFIAYWLFAYSRAKKIFYKRPLFILSGTYSFLLIFSFVAFYLSNQ